MGEPQAGEPTWWKALENLEIEHEKIEDNELMSTWNGSSQGDGVPKYGWRIALSHKFREKRTPWTVPKIHQVPALVGLSYRYIKFHRKLKRINRRPCMDFFNQQPLRQIYGVPLGGIGGGSINRGWQGEFCRWQLRPGVYEFVTTLANQFIVCIRKNGTTVYQQVLSVHSTPAKHLKSWKWEFPGSQAFYHALYPRAWTVYEIPEHKVVLTCRQVSPVIPNEYKDSSIPAAVFSWSIENKSESDLEVSIVMTMENGNGTKKSRLHHSGHFNEEFDDDKKCSGVVMHNFTYEKMPYTMTVAASDKPEMKVSKCISFDPTSDGSTIWNELHEHGHFDSTNDISENTSRGESIACAVAVETTVKSKTLQKNVDFVLSWDMPIVYFGSKEISHRRRYTRFFGASGNAGPKIALYALQNYQDWEEKIRSWQEPILSNSRLPLWYKSAIFNELYYISDGGTIWLEIDKTDTESISISNHINKHNASKETDVDHLQNSEILKEFGRFAYLEGQEYRMFNTYDVHFYASIALAALWPKLELSLQYDIATSILRADDTRFRFIMDGHRKPVKTTGVVPHDVGDPEDEPWTRVNAYFVHDTASWKDLNPKFVLQVFRDYHITKNRKFLEDMWPVCLTVMEMSMKHDKDGDGLIENGGTADQTFDGWSVTGPSAYCGGLWIAALRCTIEAANILDRQEDSLKYKEILERATKAYDKKLWNGEYFNYDSNKHSNHSDSIMADQCAGQWYLLAAGIADVIPGDKILSCLRKVYNFNVELFADGRRGAVNGMRPNGKVDQSSVQSDEVWTGVTYAVAATMLHKGMLKEGFKTAQGMYKSVWEETGMAFQTPEAILKHNHYRSLAYMRPLSIWGMQYALENTDNDDIASE
ncbi:non-lysosomal glucosylceramidase-like [Styela clava]